jgi:hypothetical protein
MHRQSRFGGGNEVKLFRPVNFEKPDRDKVAQQQQHLRFCGISTSMKKQQQHA